MLSASLLSIVQRCGEQKLPNDIKKQYGVAPEGVSKKCFCIVLILPTRCGPFQRPTADNGVDCCLTDRLWRSSSPAPARPEPSIVLHEEEFDVEDTHHRAIRTESSIHQRRYGFHCHHAPRAGGVQGRRDGDARRFR